MGTCLSKKTSSSSSTTVVLTTPPLEITSKTKLVEVEEQHHKNIPQSEDNSVTLKKEIFFIKQRKSHERQTPPITSPPNPINPHQLPSSSPPSSSITSTTDSHNITVTAAPVRTSSCTKEEVDAILIQCGRLSRSSSGKASADRKYSGSKRSFDFDHETEINNINNDIDCDTVRQHRSRSSHRRTPSREKEAGVAEHKRSGSRDRSQERKNKISGGGGSRRVSRSPGRRSETTSAPSATPTPAPGKMVPVPARDKNSIAQEFTATTAIKRVSVKKSGDIGGARTSASPRSQSPANVTRASNENTHHHQQPSLSRNSSRKAEHSRSPYRRNPMNEIDGNCLKSDTLKSQDQTNKPTAGINNKMHRTKETDHERMRKPQPQKKPDERNNKDAHDMNSNKSAGENQQEHIVEKCIQAKGISSKTNEISTISIGVENHKAQTISRSRSSRRGSRDLDINMELNPDTLLNPTSYASLLLEDIQNFHQQNTTAFSLPPSVTKACSILDAVADLNSSTSPTISSAFLESEGETSKNNVNNCISSSAHIGKMRSEVKDPIVECEVFANDDLIEPSIHKYITVRRGGDMEQQESSGSNSYVGQHWVPSSSWEPNSADSSDRWTSRSNTKDELDESICYAEIGEKKSRSSFCNKSPHLQHQVGARA